MNKAQLYRMNRQERIEAIVARWTNFPKPTIAELKQMLNWLAEAEEEGTFNGR